jgi:tRNA modification GTPase
MADNPLLGFIQPIAAIATPKGISALAIIRLSGEDCFKKLLIFFDSKISKSINKKGFRLYSGWIKDEGRYIDQVLAAIYKKPCSYTGEDMVEIFCHGGLHIKERILSICLKNGFRMATNGEFTKRALLNGKMNLTQVESLSTLLLSSNPFYQQVAAQNLAQGISGDIERICREIADTITHGEAILDFKEEGIEEIIAPDIKMWITFLGEVNKRAQRIMLFKDALRVLILGPSNSGKSSLFNKLLESERAIVSETAGTTRDYISEMIMINGIEIEIIDTAGLDIKKDDLASLGVVKAINLIKSSNLVLYIIAPDDLIRIDEHRNLIDNLIKDYVLSIGLILNKIDLMQNPFYNEAIPISVKENKGIDKVLGFLLSWTESLIPEQTEMNIAMSARQLNLINKAYDSLLEAEEGRNVLELYLAHLKDALSYLEELLGRRVLPDVLDEIFSKFCIGK